MSQHVIYKYPLEEGIGSQQVELPAGARILCAQMQGPSLFLWAIVNPVHPFEHRNFFVVGTGQPFPEGTASYISTVQQGPFVWHVFEVLS